MWRQLKGTVREIGTAIVNANGFLPIRNYAASLAADPSLPPKNFYAQARAIFEDVVKNRWRYVHDPFGIELLTHSPEAMWRLVLAGDGVGVGNGRGAGDCDCISAAIGACLVNVGFPIRIVLSSPLGCKPTNYGHVFIQAFNPGQGWLTVDPVAWPERPFGRTTPFSGFAIFDLYGKLIKQGIIKQRRT